MKKTTLIFALIVVAVLSILPFQIGLRENAPSGTQAGDIALAENISAGGAREESDAKRLDSTGIASEEQTSGAVIAGNVVLDDKRQNKAEINVNEADLLSIDVSASNAYVLNADTNSMLYSKNSDERISPASTAKMLTALTALDNFLPSDAITVGSEVEMIPSDASRAWLSQGDELSAQQLLVALLLSSGNDAAYSIAVNAGRRIEGNNRLGEEQAAQIFVDAMNQKAKEIGAVSSNFKTPDGYDAQGQYTTAFDLALIAKACLGNDVLRDIMGRYKISDKWLSGKEVTYRNTNELLNPDSQHFFPAAIGLKTGATESAGFCLASAAVINEATYICIVMGGTEETRYLDTLAIFHEIEQSLS